MTESDEITSNIVTHLH